MSDEFRIHCYYYHENIYPWIQKGLMTPYWRFYWNPFPGGCLEVNGETMTLDRDWFYVIPGYLRFSTYAERPFSQFYIHFNPNDRLPRWREIVKIPVGQEALAQIEAFRQTGTEECWAQYRGLLARSVLCGALMKLPRERFQLPPRMDARIEGLVEEVEKNRGRVRTNEDMARFCAMSRNGFIRLFTEEVGEPPQLFCRRKRIELACELLHFTEQSLEEIAAKTGFADRYHFTRVFSKLMRISPGRFRMMVRENLETQWKHAPGIHAGGGR